MEEMLGLDVMPTNLSLDHVDTKPAPVAERSERLSMKKKLLIKAFHGREGK